VWIAGEEAMPEAAAQAARTLARLESGLYLHRQKGGRMQSGMDGSDGEIFELRRRVLYSLDRATA